MENLYYRTLVLHTIKNDYASEWTLYLEDTIEGYQDLANEIVASMHGEGEMGKVISLFDLTGNSKYIDASLITDFTFSSNYHKELMDDMVAEALGEDYHEIDNEEEDEDFYVDASCDCEYCGGYPDPDYDLDYDKDEEDEEEDEDEW